MRVIARPILIEFYGKYPDAKTALENWYRIVCGAEWNNFSEMRRDFNSVDAVGNDRFVFNIKGNHYRLVGLVLFAPKRVYIRFLGTHKEYDRITNIETI